MRDAPWFSIDFASWKASEAKGAPVPVHKDLVSYGTGSFPLGGTVEDPWKVDGMASNTPKAGPVRSRLGEPMAAWGCDKELAESKVSSMPTLPMLNLEEKYVPHMPGPTSPTSPCSPMEPMKIDLQGGGQSPCRPKRVSFDQGDTMWDELMAGMKSEPMQASLEQKVPQQAKKGEKPSGPSNSIGSELHGTGQCKPCAWYWRPGSCQNGAECMHCHLCDEGEIKLRKKAKQVSLRVEKIVTQTNEPETQDTFRTASLPMLPIVEQASTTASSSEDDEQSFCKSVDVTCFRRGDQRGVTVTARTRQGTVLMMPPGLQVPPGTPTHGSALHKVGNCVPCAQFFKSRGCSLGEACAYCHLCTSTGLKKHASRKGGQALMMARLGLNTPKNLEEQKWAYEMHLVDDAKASQPRVLEGFGFLD